MRVIVALLLLASITTPTLASDGARHGFAAHYSVGTMERASRLHGLPIVRCMVASSWYPLGTWLSIESHVTGRTLTCRVSDVTAKRDVAYNRRRKIVVEFGAANIKAMCNLDYVGQEPPSACPVTTTEN